MRIIEIKRQAVINEKNARPGNGNLDKRRRVTGHEPDHDMRP